MNSPLRVLLVEDSEDDALLVLRELSRAGFDVQHLCVDTPREMKATLRDGAWDIVIADYSTPNFDGLAALKIMKESGKDLPFILISSTIDADLAVSAMKAGAHDYLMKQDFARLGPAVHRELIEVQGRQARLLAEGELRRLKEFHEDIVQNIFDGIIVEDEHQVLTFVNPAAARLLGYEPGELIGQYWTLIVPPEQQVLVQEAYQRRTQGIADRYELHMMRKDGTLIPVLVSGAPRYSEGRFCGTMAVFTDISERKRFEDQLRKLKDFNEGIVQNMYEGVGVGDEVGYFTFVNPAMASMLGYSPDELVGTHWVQTVPPDQQDAVSSADSRRRQGHTDRYEVELLRKDGSRLTAEVSGSPIYENGKFSGSLVVFTDITTRKQAEQTLRRRAEELAALHAATLTITAPHDFQSLVHSIIDQAKVLLNAPGGSISLCRPERREIEICEEMTPQGRNYSGIVLKYGEGAVGWVVDHGKPLITEDYRTWPNRSKVYDEDQPIIATLSVPLIWRGQVTGVLQVTEQAENRRFNQEDLELLSLFADQAAIALENARLFEAERAIREQAETLREAAQVLSASLEFDDVLRQILTQIKRLIVFDTANVFLYGSQGKPDRMAGIGYDNEYATSRAAIDLLRDSQILKRMAENHQPLLIADVREAPDWIWVPGAEHVRSFLCVPIMLQNQMAGALMVDNLKAGFFDDDDLRVIQSMAQHMSIAIQNARLYEAERAARERAEALREAARIMGLSLSLDEVLQAVLEQLSRVLPFDSGSTMLVENNKIAIKVSQGYGSEIDPKQVKSVIFNIETDQTCGEVARSGKPMVIQNVQQDSRWIETELSKRIRSWLGVPLISRDQVIGLFSLDRNTPDGFSADEVALAQTFASHAATAIGNARLYQAEEQLAAELMALRQASLSLTASLDLEAVLHAILDSALRFLPGSDNAHIYLYREEDETLTFGAALWADGRRGEALAAPRENGLTYTVAHSGESRVVTDMGTDPLYQFGQRHWNGAIVGLPLKIGQHAQF
jgi:PAS domain S-box-containing protein